MDPKRIGRAGGDSCTCSVTARGSAGSDHKLIFPDYIGRNIARARSSVVNSKGLWPTEANSYEAYGSSLSCPPLFSAIGVFRRARSDSPQSTSNSYCIISPKKLKSHSRQWVDCSTATYTTVHQLLQIPPTIVGGSFISGHRQVGSETFTNCRWWDSKSF